MIIDRTPPFGVDCCDICGRPLQPNTWHREPHVHDECAAGADPTSLQLALI